MSSIFNMPWTQAFDSAGNTLAGAKLYFYEAGTSTLQDVYADSNLTTALSNPVIADGSGRFAPIYLADTNYKVALYTAEDVLIWTADNIGTEEQTDDGTFAAQAINEAISRAGLVQNIYTNFPYALFKYASAATYYIDGGTVDNLYELNPVGNYDNSVSSYPYFVGFTVRFVCTRPNTETGLVQINVNNHGAKYIRRFDNSVLQPGDMQGLVTLVYDGVFFKLAENNGVCVGDIKASAISIEHNGWLLCNGQAVSRTDYAALFAVIGTNYGAGDGSTTFNLPDYRGKFLRGLGGDSAADIYTTQPASNSMSEHYHGFGYNNSDNAGTFTAKASADSYDMPQSSGTRNWNGSEGGGYYNGDVSTYNANMITTLPVGTASENRPINMAVNYFIKAR